MRFFDVNGVVRDLKDGKIGEQEAMHYFLATAVIDGLGLALPGAKAEISMGVRIAAAAVGIAILIWGIRACFEANQKGDQRDFIKRYVCVSFPIGIWISLSVLCFTFGAITIIGLGAAFLGTATHLLLLFVLILTLGIALSGYVWKRRCIERIAGAISPAT